MFTFVFTFSRSRAHIDLFAQAQGFPNCPRSLSGRLAMLVYADHAQGGPHDRFVGHFGAVAFLLLFSQDFNVTIHISCFLALTFAILVLI